MIVTGSAGMGKTLAAISTFLTLADRYEARKEPTLVPRYYKGHVEGLSAEFGTDAWLEQEMVRGVGLRGGQRLVVVISNADAFLARRADLDAALASRLFRDASVLLCVGQSFYRRELQLRDLSFARVVTLEPWPRELQERFAEAVSPGARATFGAWLDEDPTREELCCVSLHLVLALLLVVDRARPTDASTQSQLFEEVAKGLFGVVRDGFDVEERIAQLAAVAHHFFREGTEPITFTRAKLRRFLEQSGHSQKEATALADSLEYGAMLTTTRPSGDVSFEYPSWGWFFVARHVVDTIGAGPQDALAVFSKFFSPEIGAFCMEMLAAAAVDHPDAILEALRAAFEGEDGDAPTDKAARRRIARQQIGYFFAALGRDELHDELAPLVDPDSPRCVRDSWVRRGILFGLADGGDTATADAYVAALRAEREAGESAQRDTNIGFFLTFRGDQQLQVREPDSISDDASCEQTVNELVRGLGEARHRGSWRIKLFTLLDLGVHPQIAPERFDAAVRRNGRALHRIREQLLQDPERARWPEVDELSRLLERITPGDERNRDGAATTTSVGAAARAGAGTRADAAELDDAAIQALRALDRARSLGELSAVLRQLVEPAAIRGLANALADRCDDVDDLAAGSYAHPNGFDKLVLHTSPTGHKLVVHAWWPGAEPNAADAGHVHDHRWSFATAVLTGGYRFAEYEEVAPERDRADRQVFKHTYAGPGDGRAYTIVPEGPRGLGTIRDGIVKRGHLYALDAPVLHDVTIEAAEPTITLFLQGPPVRTTTRVFAPTQLETIGEVELPRLPAERYRAELRRVLDAVQQA